jgi:tRNA threonylcarbamoyl adenosine modification protein YeaZ
VRVLGIESSGRFGGVAILEDGKLVGTIEMGGRTPQGQRVMPSLEWLLARLGLTMKDIHGIGVSAGPGSFTGLRVGVASAKALAWAGGIPVVAVPTLEAMALRLVAVAADALILPLLDARNGAVHGGVYGRENWASGGDRVDAGSEVFAGRVGTVGSEVAAHGGMARLAEDQTAELGVVLQHALELADQRGLNWICPAGEGWTRYEPAIRAGLGSRLLEPDSLLAQASPQSVALIAWQKILRGETADLTTLEPIYQSKGIPAW